MNLRKIISACLFCLYIGAVAFLCFARPENIPHLSDTWLGLPADKIAHFTMFLPFPFLAYLVFEPQKKRRWWWKAIVLLAVAAAGAFLARWTEDIQARLTYRTSDIRDFLADMYGMAAGLLVTITYMLFRR